MTSEGLKEMLNDIVFANSSKTSWAGRNQGCRTSAPAREENMRHLRHMSGKINSRQEFPTRGTCRLGMKL